MYPVGQQRMAVKSPGFGSSFFFQDVPLKLPLIYASGKDLAFWGQPPSKSGNFSNFFLQIQAKEENTNSSYDIYMLLVKSQNFGGQLLHTQKGLWF